MIPLNDDDISKFDGQVMAKIKENVNHPSHYISGKYETIDIIEEWTKDLPGAIAFCIGNTLKYLSRWTKKNGVEDLEKARWYLDKTISLLHEESLESRRDDV